MPLFPILLILFASLSAAAVAYGTHPDWILRPHGLQIITASHHLQWPLTLLSILLCLLLIALVASGKRRIFWLLGLAPVAALLFHHFHSDPMLSFSILENPPFISSANSPNLLPDDDYLVGLHIGDTSYAYPYSLLYTNPVILHTDRQRRILLMWSPFANRATAFLVDHDIRATELDIVSMPANALLLYNSRLGQFINALTGTTPAGTSPQGFLTPIPVTKTTWKTWHTLHPDTQLLAIPPQYATGLPHRPVLPYFQTPPASGLPADTRITLIGSPPSPLAIPSEEITLHPANLTPDAGTPLLLYRDPASNLVRAFDRRFQPDLSPAFRLISDPKRPGVSLTDDATHTGWSLAGVAVDGDQKFKGLKLAPVPTDDDLPYPVLKYWLPSLTLTHLHPEDLAPDNTLSNNSSVPTPHLIRRRRTPRRH
jgi:hypothetical protein